MKAQKAIAGILAGLFAAGTLKGAGSIHSAAEETDTVAISVSSTVAAADGTFSAVVYLDELPDTGLCAMDFAVAYDSSFLTVNDVELLYDTGADDAEAAANPDLAGTVFRYEDTDGEIRVRWATALMDSYYWLREERAFFVLHGTVNGDVAKGERSELRLGPASRETTEGSGVINTTIIAGYVDADGNSYNCNTTLTNGYVFTMLDETGATMYGDLDMNGERTLADVILQNRVIAEEVELCAAAYANADCELDGCLSMADVTLMLRYLKGEIEGLVLGSAESSKTGGQT